MRITYEDMLRILERSKERIVDRHHGITKANFLESHRILKSLVNVNFPLSNLFMLLKSCWLPYGDDDTIVELELEQIVYQLHRKNLEEYEPNLNSLEIIQTTSKSNNFNSIISSKKITEHNSKSTSKGQLPSEELLDESIYKSKIQKDLISSGIDSRVQSYHEIKRSNDKVEGLKSSRLVERKSPRSNRAVHNSNVFFYKDDADQKNYRVRVDMIDDMDEKEVEESRRTYLSHFNEMKFINKSLEKQQINSIGNHLDLPQPHKKPRSHSPKFKPEKKVKSKKTQKKKLSLIGRSDKKGYRKHSFLDKPRMKGELKNKKQIEATLAKIKEQITKKQSMPKRKSNLSHTKRSANKKGSSRKSDLSESFKRNEKIFDSDDSGVKRDLIDTPNNIQSYTELSYSIDNAEKANRLKENISKQLHDYNKKSRKKDINAIEIDDDLNDLFVSSQNYRTNESPQRKIELEIDSEDSWELKYETIEPENQISLFKIVHNSSNNDSNKIPKNYKIFSCGVFVAYDPEKHKKRSYQQSNQFKLINLKNSEQKSSVLGKEFDYDFAYKGNSSSNEIVIKSQNNSLDQLADKNEPDRNVIIGSDSEEMSDSHLPEINEVTERGSSEFDKETRNGLGRVYSDLSGSGELQSIKIRNQHFINSKLGWKKNDSLRTDQNSKTGDLPGRDKLSSSNKNAGVDSSYTQSNTSGYYLTRNNITQQSERIVKMGVLEDRKDDIDKGLFNRLSLKPAQKKDNYSIEMGFDHENQISNNTKTDELIEIEEVEFERVGNLASEDELDSPIEISKKNKELNVNKCVSPMFRSSKNKLQKGGGIVRNSLEKSREEIIGIQKAHMVRLMENNISITSDSEFEEIRNPKRRTYDNLTEDNLPDELLEKKVINQKNLTARTGDWLKNIKKKKSKEANFKYNKLKPKLTKPTKPIRGSYLPGRLKTSYKSKQTRFPKISLTKGTPDKVSKNMMENAHHFFLK